jgi:hypothetical protein
MQGVLTKTQREIAATLDFLKRGRFFNFENVPEASAELLTQLKSTEKHFEMALKGFPSLFLDISFLSYCNKETDLPVFMVLDLDTKLFSLTVSDRGGFDYAVSFTPNLPPEIEQQYLGTIQKLGAMAGYRGAVMISAEFTGSPPASTRRRIEQAISSKLFNELFIVAEAPKWVVNVTVPAKTDPLVIGTVAIPLPNKKILKQYYLIDIFDPTPLEKVVAEEFTFMPAK